MAVWTLCIHQCRHCRRRLRCRFSSNRRHTGRSSWTGYVQSEQRSGKYHGRTVLRWMKINSRPVATYSALHAKQEDIRTYKYGNMRSRASQTGMTLRFRYGERYLPVRSTGVDARSSIFALPVRSVDQRAFVSVDVA